jgi:uncharacterized protein involved in outer membrane biogenesis
MRKILIGCGIGLVLLIVIAIVAVLRLDPNDFVGLVESRVQALTGRDFKIDGKVGHSLSLLPTVVAEGVRLQNAPWGSRPDMITAKRIEIQVALLPLFSGNVEIRGLTLVEPDVLLEIDRKGAKNWDFAPRTDQQPAATGSGSGLQHIQVRKARIEKGVIAYRDARQPPRTMNFAIDQLALTGSADKAELKGSAALNNVPVEFDAKIDHDGRLGTTGATGKADIQVKAPGIKLSGNGTVPVSAGGLSGLDMRFNAEVSDWATWAKLNAEAPRTLPPLKAEGVARVQGDALAIEALKASLGKSSATGSVRLGSIAKASGLEARLDSPLVDLTELLGSKPAKPSPDGRIFSAEPFALEGLRALSGKFDLNIAKLAMRDGKALDGVHAQALLANGKVTADPIRIRVEGKEVQIKLVADASSGKAIGLNLALDARGVSLGALAAMFDIAGAPEGSPTDLTIRFTGTGNSMRTLMAGANGDVRVVVGPGRIKNRAIDVGADVTELLNAINPTRAAEPYTELKCAAARLPIRQGVARIDNSIGIETGKVNVMIGGIIDLRNETLDLGFRPKATTGLGVGLGGLASLGRLRGSISNPKVEVDMGGAASAATQLGLAAATGGLSLLAGVALSDKVPERPCHAALSGTATSTSREAQQKQKPDATDGLTGAIKRLFGR